MHRKDNSGSTEKGITIYGSPDNCDNACREILDVMTQEAANTNRGYVTVGRGERRREGGGEG